MLEEAQSLNAPSGLSSLTPREIEVLELIAHGRTNAEAARTLNLSVHAIKFHLAGIYRRLGVSNRTAAAVVYLQSVSGSAGTTMGDIAS